MVQATSADPRQVIWSSRRCHGTAMPRVFFFGDGLKLVETTQMIDGISPMLATVYNWLVVWNMTFMTFHMLGMSSSQLTIRHIFQRGRSTNQRGYGIIIWFLMVSKFLWDIPSPRCSNTFHHGSPAPRCMVAPRGAAPGTCWRALAAWAFGS